MAEGSLVWEELPTLIRRSFDVWVTAFQDGNPGCLLQRVEPPREGQDGAVVIPFKDTRSGARYETTVTTDGVVSAQRIDGQPEERETAAMKGLTETWAALRASPYARPADPSKSTEVMFLQSKVYQAPKHHLREKR